MDVTVDLWTLLLLFGSYTTVILAGFLWLNNKLNSLTPQTHYEKRHRELEERIRWLELQAARKGFEFSYDRARTDATSPK